MSGLRVLTVVAIGIGAQIYGAAARAELGVPIAATKPLNTDFGADPNTDRAARIAADGSGHWVAVWVTLRSDYDISVARSIDGGENWSNPVPLNNNAPNENKADWDPDIATDDRGNWVAVWGSQNPLSGQMSTDFDIHVARSIDNGANWSNPIALNTNAATDAGDDGGARIATDGQGHWVAVWASNENLGGTIGTDYDLLVARSIDNGATWSPPKPLNTNAATDTGIDAGVKIATDRQGHWVAVWHSNDSLGNTIGTDYDILVARSVDNGENWSIPVPVNSNAASDSGNDLSPDIGTDRHGHWVAAWNGVFSGNDADILVARSVDNGANWSNVIPLNTNADGDTASDTRPMLAADDDGNWAATWESKTNLGGGMQKREILLARSINNGANWSSPSGVSGDVGDDFDSDSVPSFATDRHGLWVFTWDGSNALGDTTGGDFDVLLGRFALPDCNKNLIADSTEVLLGLLPDINFNKVPDICEIIDGPAPAPPGGCGTGLCGVGAPFSASLTLFGFAVVRRSFRSSSRRFPQKE